MPYTKRTPSNRVITYRRPYLYPEQEAALFDPRRYSVIESSTKAGKTSGCIVWQTEQAILGPPGVNHWWVAPVSSQADIAFTRLKRSLPNNLIGVSESNKFVTLPNKSRIWFKSADKPDSLYGEDVYSAVIDEASRVKEGAWHAVRSTLTATRGPARILGNVRGRTNWFYKLARRGELGTDPEIGYHKITAYQAAAAGVIDPREIEDAKSILPEIVFRELYLAEPADDGGNPFGIQHIAACVGPLSLKPPMFWGIDLAKSVDWTVLIGLDADGAVCRVERWQGPWSETEKRILLLVRGGHYALADSTGVGDPIVERLAAENDSIEPYLFTAASKQRLMEGLAAVIQSRNVRFPEGVVRQELEQFEYLIGRNSVRYSAPEGFHDDAVCALALAVECRRRNGAMAVVLPMSTDRSSHWRG